MSERYVSKFSGDQIDDAVEKALHLDEVTDSYMIESSESDKYNLNDLINLNDGLYRIKYYTNSADDNGPLKPIDVRQRELNWCEREQRYEGEAGITYYRKYSSITGSFSPWVTVRSVKIVNPGEISGVYENDTIVFRKVSETNRSLKCKKYNGNQTVQVSNTPT